MGFSSSQMAKPSKPVHGTAMRRQQIRRSFHGQPSLDRKVVVPKARSGTYRLERRADQHRMIAFESSRGARRESAAPATAHRRHAKIVPESGRDDARRRRRRDVRRIRPRRRRIGTKRRFAKMMPRQDLVIAANGGRVGTLPHFAAAPHELFTCRRRLKIKRREASGVVENQTRFSGLRHFVLHIV